jgi:predicted MFS family arabinose efflux permease
VAVQVIWSGRVYDERPSAGLAATVAMNALGLLLGPPLLGALADQTGFGAVFAVAGLLLLATVALAPREPLN